MRSRAAVATLAVCLATSPALADDIPRSAPEQVGLSSARLERIKALLKADVEKGRLPGAVVAIARKGKLAYYEAVGYRDADKKLPMQGDEIFSIASMTKPIVSIAIMMLLEEGKLFLSDPVGKYLPQLADMKVGVVKTDAQGKTTVETVAVRRQPTIQDLLRHTSGFAYGGRGVTPVHKTWPVSSSGAATTLTKPEFIEALSKAPLLYQPGEVWDYSLSVDALGLIVEAVTGKPLSAFLAERIWGPLGMVDTSFVIPDAKKDRYARAFPNDPLTNRPQSVLHAAKAIKFECGGGCAASTAMDYLRFAQMLANGGILDGHRLLSRTTLEMMTSDQLGPAVRARTTSTVLSEGYTFGLGFAVRMDAGLSSMAGSKGDYTWGGAYGTYFWVDPKEQMAVVFMAAAPGAIRVHYRYLMRSLALQAIVD